MLVSDSSQASVAVAAVDKVNMSTAKNVGPEIGRSYQTGSLAFSDNAVNPIPASSAQKPTFSGR